MDELTAAVAEASAALAKIQNLAAAERGRIKRLGLQSSASSALQMGGLAARHANEALTIWLATLKDCQEFARNPYSGKVVRLPLGNPIPEGWKSATEEEWLKEDEAIRSRVAARQNRSDRYE